MARKLELDLDGWQAMDVQVKEVIRDCINKGKVKHGDRYPTLRELNRKEFSVNFKLLSTQQLTHDPL